MIIFENGFMTLAYDPATDILSFAMPSATDVLMPELGRCLATAVEHVRNYDVKKLLLEARETDVWAEEGSYGPLIAGFYRRLAATRLQKVARLVAPGSARERLIGPIAEGAAPEPSRGQERSLYKSSYRSRCIYDR